MAKSYWNQGDANFWVGLQKYDISAALCSLKINLFY